VCKNLCKAYSTLSQAYSGILDEINALWAIEMAKVFLDQATLKNGKADLSIFTTKVCLQLA
jgi:hypothetical protein